MIIPGMQVEKVASSPDGRERVNALLTCVLCGKPSRVDGLLADEMALWLMGAHVQAAFPALSPGQRETLMSGSHEECFDAALAPAEEDPEDAMWPPESWFDPEDLAAGDSDPDRAG